MDISGYTSVSTIHPQFRTDVTHCELYQIWRSRCGVIFVPYHGVGVSQYCASLHTTWHHIEANCITIVHDRTSLHGCRFCRCQTFERHYCRCNIQEIRGPPQVNGRQCAHLILACLEFHWISSTQGLSLVICPLPVFPQGAQWYQDPKRLYGRDRPNMTTSYLSVSPNMQKLQPCQNQNRTQSTNFHSFPFSLLLSLSLSI